MKTKFSKKSVFTYRPLTAAILIIIGVLTLTFLGCTKNDDNDDDIEGKNGTLFIKQRTWNNITQKKSTVNDLKSSYSWNMIDLKSSFYEMKFTTTKIKEGIKDSDIKWVTVYTSNKMELGYDRDFQVEMPAGNYKGFGLVMGNEIFWVISDGNKTIEIPDSNGGEVGSRGYSIFGADGLYEVGKNGLLTLEHPGEKMGTSFTILPGKSYTLTMRMNFDQMIWNDNDENGVWSDGDTHEDPTFHEGLDTMWDFIFEEIKE